MKAITSNYKHNYIPIKYITLVFERENSFYVKNINNDEIQITRETYNALVKGMDVIK